MCEVLDYIGQHLLGPVLAAVIGGPLAALTFRYFDIGREVAQNNVRASELDEDLRRWVEDRDRELENRLRGIVNSAGNQIYSGSTRNAAVAAMRQALHEYRDEATRKVREYSGLARSENGWHRRHRRRHGVEPQPLGLRGQDRIRLDRWRQRPHIVDPGGDAADLIVQDDPTADEPCIAPLETETGLTWAHASRSTD